MGRGKKMSNISLSTEHRRSFDLSFLLSKESLIIDIFDDGVTELCYDHHVESTFTLLYMI